MASGRLAELLAALAAAEVEFIVVGMVAGVLQGVPGVTFDVDIVHRRSDDNVDRLIAVLGAIDAVYRTDHRRLTPKPSLLRGPGHNLFETRLGDLDCLGTIDESRDYESLLPHTRLLPLSEVAFIRVLDLETLLEVKTRAGRAKDLAVLPLLRATIKERDGG